MCERSKAEILHAFRYVLEFWVHVTPREHVEPLASELRAFVFQPPIVNCLVMPRAAFRDVF